MNTHQPQPQRNSLDIVTDADLQSVDEGPRPRVRVSGWWRALAIFCLLLLALGTAAAVSMFEQFSAQVRYMQQQVSSTAYLKQVAVLLDEHHQAAVLVTLDAQDVALQIQRLNAVREGREESMQLWALRSGAQPVSLGVFGSSVSTLRLPVTDARLAGVTALAISVENKGGAEPGQAPNLPYLFTGDLIQKAR